MSELVVKKKSNKWIIFVIVGVVLALAIALTLVFVSRSLKTSRSAAELETANKYYEELNYEEAIAHYIEAIAINPSNLEAYIGIYNAYIALADHAIAEGDYSQAISYYNDAANILNNGLDYIDSGELRDMLEDLRGKKKEAKENRENEEGSDDSQNTGSTPVLPEEAAAHAEILDTSLSNPEGDYYHMLAAIAAKSAYDYDAYQAIEYTNNLIAGDTLTLARFILPNSESGGNYDYSADWCTHNYWIDETTYSWNYAIPLEEANQAAYTICGVETDFATYDWSSLTYDNIRIEYYDGVECLMITGGWAGGMGQYMYTNSISPAEYIGENTWKVVANVNYYSDGYGYMAYDYKYCEVIYYLKYDEKSTFNFVITACNINPTPDTEWAALYSEFLSQYKHSNAGGYWTNYLHYGLLYIDDDDIPELLLEDPGNLAYNIYTVKDGEIHLYNCCNYPDYGGQNYVFIASGVGGTDGYMEYLPYSGKLLVTHTDYDYTGYATSSFTEYFDGTNWTIVAQSNSLYHEEDGSLPPEIQHNIDAGYLSPDEYSYTYDAPGYDPNAEWLFVELPYSLDNIW